MADQKTETLTIDVVTRGKRKYFRYQSGYQSGSPGLENELLAELLTAVDEIYRVPVSLTVTRRKKVIATSDVESSTRHKHAEFNGSPSFDGGKYLAASRFKTGDKLQFIAKSGSRFSTSWTPRSDFALKYWILLTANPKGSAQDLFYIEEHMG